MNTENDRVFTTKPAQLNSAQDPNPTERRDAMRRRAGQASMSPSGGIPDKKIGAPIMGAMHESMEKGNFGLTGPREQLTGSKK